MTKKYSPSNQMEVRAWSVAVPGYGESVVYAVSRGRAMADCWRSDAFAGLTFGLFMRRCTVRATRPPDAQFGAPIWVSGQQAFYAYRDNQYVHFAYPGGQFLYCSHPYDVTPEEYRPAQYRKQAA